MTVTQLIDNTPSLPPAPEVLPKLVKIMKDPDTDSNDVVGLISTDPAIVAGVLKLSNSGAYSPPSPVTDLSDAVSMLGIKEVYRIVSLVTSGDFLDGALPSMDISKGGLWEHSLAVALVMDELASEMDAVDGLPYTIGLLHDIGKLLLHLGCGEKYVNVFKKVETERMSIIKAEDTTFGFDHAEAGATMLKSWGFPDDIWVPIMHQYNPNNAPEEHRRMAGALHVANWGAAVIGSNDGRDSWAIEMCTDAFPIETERLEMAVLEAKMRLEQAKKAIDAGNN